MRRLALAALSFVLMASLCLCLGLGGVLLMARSDTVYRRGFLRDADTRASGVLPTDYPALAQQLAAYFRGEADTPQSTVLRFGAPGAAYSEGEMQHLTSLRTLFGTLFRLWLACCALLLVSGGVLFRMRRCLPRRSLCRATLCGAGATLLLPLGIAIWAVADFYGFFYALHTVLFPNDRLWILSPETDLLIQLMPQPFFVHLARLCALCLLPALGYPVFLLRRCRPVKE